MKGFWHIPAMAFVLGGVAAIQTGWAFYVLLMMVLLWISLYRKRLALFMVILLYFVFGWHYLPSPSETKPSSSFSGATISSAIEETSHTIQMILKHESGEKFQLVYYKNEDQDQNVPPDWHHGAVCNGFGDAEPFARASNPGQFDYRAYMLNKGVNSQIILNDIEDLHCEGRSYLSYMNVWRDQVMRKVKANVYPGSYGWIKALIFGETDELNEDTVEWFREFNLSHILAISGLHVGLTIGSLYFVIYRMGVGTRRQAQFFVLLLLPVYGFLAGAAPSVIRASLMALILLLLTLINRKIPLTDILAVVAFLLLLLNPFYFHQIGFQFSFLVTFSLILSLSILKQYESTWMQTVVISLVSQFSILALQIHYFYEIQPFSLFVNLILVPYFSFIVIPVVLILFISCLVLPVFSYSLSFVLVEGHEKLLSMIQMWTRLLDFQWVIGEVTPIYIFFYTLIFIFKMKWWGERKHGLAFFAGVSAVSVLILYSAFPYLSPKGTVTMLDVGQGDAFVIELPYRRGVIMVDAAGPPVFNENQKKTADQVILPFLKSKGIDHMNAMFISHQDSDHSGSAPFILNEIDVEQIIVSQYYVSQWSGEDTLRVEAGDRISVAGHVFHILHPGDDQGEPNDNSLVLDSMIGGKRWLFTGDISTKVEDIILKKHSSLWVDVLKVGHHGSRTSTSRAWVDRLNPEIALISAGVDNRYGHPHAEVTERLEKRGVLLLETNRHGAVQFIFSGQSGTFSPYFPYNASRE
ncbi:DNA internalization-related competence protein ComEC/Rec2 [Halobacillus litoralis]|nr:DNA internalization-related competence protein ComEC/Rec2 [Halobacillus litoralis]